MPMGIPSGKLKFLHLDKTKNVISGSSAKGGEGALVADEECRVKISQKWQLYNEQVSTSTTSFWLVLHVAATGLEVEIPGSRTTFDVEPKRQGVDYFTTNEVEVEMEPGDYIFSRAITDSIDGAYAMTNSDTNPLCVTYINESGLTA